MNVIYAPCTVYVCICMLHVHACLWICVYVCVLYVSDVGSNVCLLGLSAGVFARVISILYLYMHCLEECARF